MDAPLLRSSLFLSGPASNWGKQTKVEVSYKKRLRQNLVKSLKATFNVKKKLLCVVFKS